MSQTVELLLYRTIVVPDLAQAVVADGEKQSLLLVLVRIVLQSFKKPWIERYFPVIGVLKPSDKYRLIVNVEVPTLKLQDFASPGSSVKSEINN